MILERLAGKNIFIYGTGHVARKFYKVLGRHGLQHQVRSFVKTNKAAGEELFENLPVYCIEELHLAEDDLLCLAVHASIRKEIEAVVQSKTDQYLWIYPYLYELMFGEAEQKNVKISVAALLKDFQNDLRLGIRLAVIEQQEGKNTCGFDTYLKAQTLHCNRETAIQRLKQFRELIANWKQTGYQKEYKLTFTRNYGVIDGNHRLAMAVYTGQEYVYGDVYPTDLSVTEIHGKEPIQAKELLLQHGFSACEVQKLEQIQNQYFQKYIEKEPVPLPSVSSVTHQKPDRQEESPNPSPADKHTEISLIIPVYNVLEWLDPCLDSVVHQTFSDFEILLIDDGSTDGSHTKCQEWAEKDPRIRLITKENEGPSKARNLGIQKANGDYLAFLDADDWVDPRYLEKMYRRAQETNADMVECDVYRVNSETDVKTYRVCSGYMGRDYTLEEHMKYGYTAMWKCLFHKKLFTEYGISFPDCHSEARALYPLLLALSNRVENVHEALYYYRIFRKGSLTAQPRPVHEAENAIGIQALDLLLQGFERCGLYAAYEETLQKIVKLKLADLLSVFFYRKEKEDFRQLTENYRAFVKQKFPDAPDFRYLTWGGYNLNRILGHMNILHDPYCRFNFSSLVSLMHPVAAIPSCKHRNRYRELMLKREIENQFWDILKEIQPEYLILDFIEERFDLLAYGEGYLTKSDAFDGARWDSPLENGKTVSRQTEECHTLWEESCLLFLKRMQTESPSTRLILVQNYLSEKVGDIHKQDLYSLSNSESCPSSPAEVCAAKSSDTGCPDEYKTLNEIRQINRILKRYYHFFEEHCSRCDTIPAYKAHYYFTDRQYEYGAVPSHLNEIVNQEIAGMVERSLNT